MSNQYDTVVGIDVASKKLDVYDTNKKQHTIIDNSAAETKRFAKRIQQASGTTLVVMEATGGYEN